LEERFAHSFRNLIKIPIREVKMLSDSVKNLGQLTSRNSPLILTSIGVTGVAYTSYLTARASFKACDVIRKEEAENGVIEDRIESIKYYAPKIWKFYIPAGLAGIGTMLSVVASNRIENGRTAAAVSAYTLTEKAFSKYREKVVDEIGKHKEQFLRDDIVREEIAENPPNTNTVIIGSGEVLCCELYTKRYFMSDMETLRRAQNEINLQALNDLYVTLDTFYDLVKLPHTSHSNEIGWDSDKMMELEFSTVLTEDGKPCLAFNYSYIKPI
jgi:hypothetical protein